MLSVIIERDQPNIQVQVTTTIETIAPSIPSGFALSASFPPLLVPWLLTYSPSDLIQNPPTFATLIEALHAAPKIVYSLRPPRKPPYTFLPWCHLQKRVVTAVG
jgi:hypothetical protein